MNVTGGTLSYVNVNEEMGLEKFSAISCGRTFTRYVTSLDQAGTEPPDTVQGPGSVVVDAAIHPMSPVSSIGSSVIEKALPSHQLPTPAGFLRMATFTFLSPDMRAVTVSAAVPERTVRFFSKGLSGSCTSAT